MTITLSFKKFDYKSMIEMLEYKGMQIYTHPKVYKPAEDTFLLAENLQVKRTDEVLEIGTGVGIISIIASRRARKVIATDINKYAIKCAIKNIINNKAFNIEIREGNLFEPVQGEKFDLILFNSPYLPISDDEKIDDELNASWDGGADGRSIIDKFLDCLKDHLKEGGRVQLVQSSLSDIDKTLKKLEKLGFKASITAKKKYFFEEIVIITGIL